MNKRAEYINIFSFFFLQLPITFILLSCFSFLTNKKERRRILLKLKTFITVFLFGPVILVLPLRLIVVNGAMPLLLSFAVYLLINIVLIFLLLKYRKAFVPVIIFSSLPVLVIISVSIISLYLNKSNKIINYNWEGGYLALNSSDENSRSKVELHVNRNDSNSNSVLEIFGGIETEKYHFNMQLDHSIAKFYDVNNNELMFSMCYYENKRISVKWENKKLIEPVEWFTCYDDFKKVIKPKKEIKLKKEIKVERKIRRKVKNNVSVKSFNWEDCYFKNPVSGENYFFVVYNKTVSTHDFNKFLKENNINEKIVPDELCKYHSCMGAPMNFQGTGLPEMLYFKLSVRVNTLADAEKVKELYTNTEIWKDLDGYGPAGKNGFQIDFNKTFKGTKEIHTILDSLKSKKMIKEENFEINNANAFYAFMGSYLTKEEAVKLKNKMIKLFVPVKVLELRYVDVDL